MLIKHIDGNSLKEMEKFMKELLNTDFKEILNTKQTPVEEPTTGCSNQELNESKYSWKIDGIYMKYAIPVPGIPKDHITVEKSGNEFRVDSDLQVLPFGVKNISVRCTIPKEFINSEIDAKYENGLLTVTLEKREDKVKTIKIN